MENVLDVNEKLLKMGAEVIVPDDLNKNVGTITHISDYEVDGPMYHDDPPMQTMPRVTVRFDDGIEVFTTDIWEADYYREIVTYICEEIELIK